jgi:hypothetical protein
VAPGVTGRGGTPIDLRHGKTSKDRLKVVWTHPVWQPKPVAVEATGQRTVAGAREHALPLAEAYALITGDDQRPLLILRECELCKGTDHALLSRDLDNEQTVLLSHWFHCVKLPPNVLDAQHPFYNLFARAKDGEAIPHLFFCDADGSNKAALPGDQSQTELWETMFGFLERNYQGDAKKAVKELRTLLAQFDKVDNMEQDVKARMDREIDKRGVDTERVKKLELELADLKKQRQALLAREQKIRGLARRDLNAPKPAVGTATGR